MFDQYGDVTSMLEYKRRGTSASGYTFYWADMNGDEVSDFDFMRGKSIWISTSDEVSLTQSGAVPSGQTVVNIAGGGDFVQTGNCTPRVVKLSELVFSDIARGDNIQMFDQYGDVVAMLEYKRKGTAATGYTFYWADMDGNEIQDYEFQPGQAFWLSFANEGTMTIPSAL